MARYFATPNYKKNLMRASLLNYRKHEVVDGDFKPSRNLHGDFGMRGSLSLDDLSRDIQNVLALMYNYAIIGKVDRETATTLNNALRNIVAISLFYDPSIVEELYVEYEWFISRIKTLHHINFFDSSHLYLVDDKNFDVVSKYYLSKSPSAILALNKVLDGDDIDASFGGKQYMSILGSCLTNNNFRIIDMVRIHLQTSSFVRNQPERERMRYYDHFVDSLCAALNKNSQYNECIEDTVNYLRLMDRNTILDKIIKTQRYK